MTFAGAAEAAVELESAPFGARYRNSYRHPASRTPRLVGLRSRESGLTLRDLSSASLPGIGAPKLFLAL